MIWLLPLSHQQGVSLSQSSCAVCHRSSLEMGGGGGVGGMSQIIRRWKCLVLCKSFSRYSLRLSIPLKVWIRIWIWIRGSMPLTNESGSCYFRHWPSRCQQKNNFFIKFFLLITFLRYIYVIFQRWKVKKSHKIVGIKGFLTIFAW
jgi:hypothetical protein